MPKTAPLAVRAILLAALSLPALQGCAGNKPSSGRSGGKPVKVDESTDLPQLAKAVKTREDSLVLDLLLGYRMLLLGHPDPATLDKATLQRSRKAFERLEHALRHGGLKPVDKGERVYSISNEDKLSLQEVLKSASAAAGNSARAGDWEKARARWREILQSKPAVSWAMEEASWGLALSDALASGLPDGVKKKLREVDESYARELPQDEIARQVKDLLNESIPDEKLRRELKKLANRAWERDKRAGRLSQPGAAPAAPATPADDPAAAPPVAGAGAPASPPPAAAPSAASPEAVQAMAQVDTLISQGKYIPALRALEAAAPAGADPAWARERKSAIGDRYCEEKRKSAANGFKDFKAATADAQRAAHLRRTAADLDSCLFYFPDNPVAQKVRRNREMVEGEMRKLKP